MERENSHLKLVSNEMLEWRRRLLTPAGRHMRSVVGLVVVLLLLLHR